MKNLITNSGIIAILIAVILLIIYMTQGMVSNAMLGISSLLLVGGILAYIFTNRLYNK